MAKHTQERTLWVQFHLLTVLNSFTHGLQNPILLKSFGGKFFTQIAVCLISVEIIRHPIPLLPARENDTKE